MEMYIRDQITLMEDGEEKEWIESMCDRKKFLFTYNSIVNINLNSDHEIMEFQWGWFIALEFSAFSINFKMKTNLESTHNYNFYLWSIYLIDHDQSKSMPISIKRKQDLDT